MTVDESKALNKGTRVYWRGDAVDSGIITETSWDAVTIAWNNGKVARVHHARNSARAETAAYCVTVSLLCKGSRTERAVRRTRAAIPHQHSEPFRVPYFEPRGWLRGCALSTPSWDQEQGKSYSDDRSSSFR